MTLRPAMFADVSAMAALHASSFKDIWDEKSIATLLASPGTFAFLDENGFVLARAVTGEAEILTIAVAPSVRRQGLGRALMEAAIRHARALGAEALFLEVGTENAAARALYESLGFARAGRRKAYYEGQDALVLKLDLPPLGK